MSKAISADTARDMTPVLYEKFAYSGGEPAKAKETGYVRSKQDSQTAFLNIHSFLKKEKELNSNDVLTDLMGRMEIEHLNARFLAVADLLIRHHDITNISQVSVDDLRKWLEGERYWSELIKTMPKMPPPNIYAQMQDIFRYMARILAYPK
jgi:hypothetical protein